MANRNKKVLKLRTYRDKLLARVTTLEGDVRNWVLVMREVRKALQQEDTLRAYALATDDDQSRMMLEDIDTNEVVKELALAYRVLNVERRYTEEVQRAVLNKDWLRTLALCADHQAEVLAHDKMMTEWSRDHGYTRGLRKEMKDADII